MAQALEATWRQRLLDPAWHVPLLGALFLIGLLFSRGYVMAWAFLALLLMEVAWPWSLRAVGHASLHVEGFRDRIAPLKRYPGGLVGLVALAVGIVLGNLFPDQLLWLGAGVRDVVSAIGRSAHFIIFFTLTPAIAGMLRAGGAGRFALHVNLIYLATTVVAGLFAILAVSLVFQLRFVGPEAQGFAQAVGQVGQNIGNLLFTSRPFLAIWSGVGIALLMYGFRLRGVEAAIGFVGNKLVELLGDVLKILLPFILFALGVFITTGFREPIARARAEGAIPDGVGFIGSLSPEQAYGVAVALLVLLAVIWIGTWSWVVMKYTRLPYRTFMLGYFSDVFPYAWASSSSAATIPINLERADEGLKVRREVREFIIPLGATINLDGTMIGGMLTAAVAAQMVGYTPTVLDLLTIMIPMTLVTIGAPGIPGGLALLAGPPIAAVLPLPPGTEAIFIAIFVGFNLGLSDQFRTGVNSVGNGILSRLFEYWYPRHYLRRPVGRIALPEGVVS